MPQKKQTYQEAIGELQEILARLESNDPNVDELAKDVRRAAELIKFCKQKLHATEEEVEKIIGEIDVE